MAEHVAEELYRTITEKVLCNDSLWSIVLLLSCFGHSFESATGGLLPGALTESDLFLDFDWEIRVPSLNHLSFAETLPLRL